MNNLTNFTSTQRTIVKVEADVLIEGGVHVRLLTLSCGHDYMLPTSDTTRNAGGYFRCRGPGCARKVAA